jgi:hypothetical protein
VNRLELGVRQRSMDQYRACGILMEESLEIVQRLAHRGDRRRHIGGLGQRYVSGSDPVLRGAELTRLLLRAATAGEQHAMDLPDQPQRERQLRQALQSVVHRPHIVDDVLHVTRQAASLWTDLECEDILQRALCSLDLGTEHRLTPDIHGDEEIWIRQHARDTVQTSERLVCLGEQRKHGGIDAERWVRRQGRGDEGPVAGRLFHIAARARSRIEHGHSLFRSV